MKKTHLVSAVLAAGAALPALGAPPTVSPDARARIDAVFADGGTVVENELIVRFDLVTAQVLPFVGAPADGRTGFASLDGLGVQLGVTELRPQFPGADPRRAAERGLPDLSGYYVVRFDSARAMLEEALTLYAADPHVLAVEPIGVHPVDAVPNDGNYASQWHLNQSSDIDIDAPEAWDVETGDPQIVVAVLDTGVRYYHKDLGGSGGSASNPGGAQGNMWINAAEKNGAPGVDDDGNGYVDDWIGWDFVTGLTGCHSTEDCSTPDNDPRDHNGHGTHCAGIVAALNNNGYAVSSPGGGWGNGSLQAAGNGVRVMPMRIGYTSSTGGGYVRMDFAASAFYYAANNGARIASCSWGSSNSGGIDAAVTYFTGNGGLVFKAAGNSNSQTADFLCSRSDVQSVAATDQSDHKASFSSYGTWVDISAPGVSILSTWHVYSDPTPDYIAYLDGTSMATPLAASVAAVVWSQDPARTGAQVWSLVRDTAESLDAANPSYVGKLGSGRVNLNLALGGTPPPPPPPPPPPSGAGLVVALSNGTVVPGVGAVDDDDLVLLDDATGTWSLYFDGSDVGVSGLAIDALAVLPDGDLLISFSAAGSVPGVSGTVDDSDVVRFTPTSLGEATAGSFSLYFDGSDVGLSTNAEDVDALGVLADGRLLVSTTGNPSVPGLSSLADEDVIVFTPSSLGANTAGTWGYWFDGSDVGWTSSSENCDALVCSGDGATLSLSSNGNFAVTGASGANEDLADFTFSSQGANTSGSFSLGFDGTADGLPSGTNVAAAWRVQ